MSSNALRKLKVQDRTMVSMDVDICSHKFRKWKATSERESKAMQPIETFLTDMDVMIKNSLPCFWDEKLQLYPVEHYDKILKEATSGLINVPYKGAIPLASEYMRNCSPALPPGPFFLD